MVPLGDEAEVKLISVRLKKMLILTQDRSMVCAEHTINSEIILDAPDGTPRRRGSSGSSFGSEIVLDAPDGTAK